jgi:hypothetical protein
MSHSVRWAGCSLVGRWGLDGHTTSSASGSDLTARSRPRHARHVDSLRRRHRWLTRLVVLGGMGVLTLILLTAGWIGITLYRIDHAVHHVAVRASLLVRGKNDLLAMVKGPDHSDQIYVLRAAGGHGHTAILKIPNSLGLPLPGGGWVPIQALSLQDPATIIAGLDRLGIPVSRYVGIDLHTFGPNSARRGWARESFRPPPSSPTQRVQRPCSSRWHRTSTSDPGPPSPPSSRS